jgi:hypothetical protein
MTKKTGGIILIYCAAFVIMLSILFLFKVIRFRFAYTTAACGFLLYVVGLFLTREGKLTPYKIGMVVLSLLLIGVSIIREVFRLL